MRKFIVICLGLTLTVGLTAVKAQAVAITPGDGWQRFQFLGQGSAWYDPSSFEFTLVSNGILEVTDAFNAGDQFSVYDSNLGLLGNTSDVPVSNAINDFPDSAFTDPAFSHASFLLNPGSYIISGFAVKSPYNEGGAYLRIDFAPVPLPPTVLLLGTGFLGLVGWRRFRRD
jgi:hypothetical protein